MLFFFQVQRFEGDQSTYLFKVQRLKYIFFENVVITKMGKTI